MAKKSVPQRVERGIKSSTLTGEGKQMRFLDGFITAGVAVGSALWTATRPTTGQQFGWGLFWSGLGLLMAVQGSHELRYGGFGVLGANATVLALRAVHPDLVPTASSGRVAIPGDVPVDLVQGLDGYWR